MEGGFLFPMFEKFHNLIKRVEKLNVNKLVKGILEDKSIQDEMVRMNTMDQLYDEGIDSKGNPLGHYTEATIQGTHNFEGKIQKGQRYDHITLNDKGIFYASEKVKLFSDGMVFIANTQKTSSETVYDQGAHGQVFKIGKKKKIDTDLQKEYGKDILGLTYKNLSYVIKEVKRDFPGAIRKTIFK